MMRFMGRNHSVSNSYIANQHALLKVISKIKFMTIEQLHTISEEDWARIEVQFSEKYGPVLTFVTENKGTVAEGREIYIDSFIYYIQLLELRGTELIDKADQIIYSFARKIWVHKLSRRNVDTNYVKHRREYFEMEDAFHDIDSINERSKKTSEKLADLGEPARTLITEHIGKNIALEDLYTRLRVSDEDRAFKIVARSIRKLIKLTEKKEFEHVSEDRFGLLVRYVLDNPATSGSDYPDDEKVCLTMIARTVAMIRNFSARKNRLNRLEALKVRFEPDKEYMNEEAEEKKQSKMKPILTFGITALIAVVISTITAFGILAKSQGTDETISENLPDTSQSVEPVVEAFVEKKPQSAFLIDPQGYLITAAQDISGGGLVKLRNKSLEQNLSARVVYTDTVLNISVLKCDSMPDIRVPYRFSSEDPRVGQPLFTVGIEKGDVLYEEGFLNASNDRGIGRSEFKTVPVGSPVLSDRGQILGVITEGVDDQNSLSRLLKNSELVKLFESLESTKGIKITPPHRNKLYYSDRADQIEKISPFIFNVENPAHISETIASASP